MGAHRSCPLGNRAEKSNGALGQFIWAWLGMDVCQRAKSRLDSRVNPSGPFAARDERLDSSSLFSGCQTQAIVQDERFSVLSKRLHEAFLIRGEYSATF